MGQFIEITCPRNLFFIRPVVDNSLLRIGNKADGGYVISLNAIKQTQTFLSLGLGENWSFESAVSKINPTAPIDVYDDTVSFGFFLKTVIKGLIKFVFFQDSKSNFLARLYRLKSYYTFWVKESANKHHRVRITKQSFNEILLKYPKEMALGIKIDIEGSEWEILDLITRHQEMIEFMLIEIHDFAAHQRELNAFLGEVADSFTLSHLHANNFEGLGLNGFPKVFEITLIRKSGISAPEEFRKELPILGLDVPNARNRPDFRIKFI